MRGRPLIEWLCFGVVWALLLIPLARVTGLAGGRPPVPAASAGHQPDTEREPAWLRLVFSEAPESMIVYSGDTAVWRESNLHVENEQLVDLVMTAGGPDVLLDLTWNHAGRRAVEVVVEPVEGRSWHSVVWREGERMHEKAVFE